MYHQNIAHDPLQAALEASQTQRPTPSELTMFRLLMVFHEIHDFPVKLAKRTRDQNLICAKTLKSFEEEEFYLVYEALGQKIAMPLALDDFCGGMTKWNVTLGTRSTKIWITPKIQARTVFL